MRSMMLTHKIPYQESHLQPVGLAEVYTRFCGTFGGVQLAGHSCKY